MVILISYHADIFLFSHSQTIGETIVFHSHQKVDKDIPHTATDTHPILDICHSQKLCSGYYTYGSGILRI